jgi:hypothetical protein
VYGTREAPVLERQYVEGSKEFIISLGFLIPTFQAAQQQPAAAIIE